MLISLNNNIVDLSKVYSITAIKSTEYNKLSFGIQVVSIEGTSVKGYVHSSFTILCWNNNPVVINGTYPLNVEVREPEWDAKREEFRKSYYALLEMWKSVVSPEQAIITLNF